MRRITILFFLLSLLNFKLSAQKLSQEEKEILMLQDTRSLGENNKLLSYLNSDSKNLVIRSLYALANIGDTNTIDNIGKLLLGNGDPEIKEYAAFALGQIPNRKSAEYLSKALDHEQNLRVICGILNAIGRTGDEEDLNKVCDYQTENDSINACIAMSIARFGMRKIKNERGFEKLAKLISSRDVKTEGDAAYAFNRIGDDKSLANYKEDILKLTLSKNPETRMWAFSALGKTKETTYLKNIYDSFLRENVWRVKINMLNALLNFTPNEQMSEILLMAVGDDNLSVSLLAIQNLGKIFADKPLNARDRKRVEEKLKGIMKSSPHPPSKGESAAALAAIFKEKIKDDLLKVYKSTNDWNVKTGIIKAFGKFEDGKIYRTVRELISDDVRKFSEKNPGSTNALASSIEMLKLYRAFIEMLTTLDKKVDDEDKNNIRLIYSEFLSSKDPILTNLTLTALMDSMYIKYRPETQKIIMFDYEELKLPSDADAMQLYIQAMGELKMNDATELLLKNLKSENYDIAKTSADALKRITGNDYESHITAQRYKTDFDWGYIEKLNDKRFVVMKTNKGDIKLELFPEYAPFTVQSFLKLAEKHFYDSTVFHRVVPNFVIQGGDPTGTGYSGPGYSIRSEFSPLTYETGYLGMASSGKDTEGSQFFITHSPQPHLDGRYTIFGKVTEGMDVVNRIQIGDVLLQIMISTN